MTDHTTPDGAPGAASPGRGDPRADPTDPGEGSFARWIRSLGMVRSDGWAGGVCAAVAGRIGVDPLIVRGAFVVVTLLGFPGLWLYAIGWALLPDARGRILIVRPRASDGAWIGIGITALLAVIASWGGYSLTALLWNASLLGGFFGFIGTVVFWVALIGAAVAFIIWLVRKPSARGDAPVPPGGSGGYSGTPAASGAAAGGMAAPPVPPARPDPGHGNTGTAGGGGVPGAGGTGAAAAEAPGNADAASGGVSGAAGGGAGSTGSAEGVVPAAYGGDASGSVPAPDGSTDGVDTSSERIGAAAPADNTHGATPGPAGSATEPATDIEAWREQYDGWRQQHEAWRQQQAAGDRLAREEEAARRRAEAESFRAESARLRAERRKSRPRASLSFVLVCLGAALLAGAAAALARSAGGGEHVLASAAVAAFLAAAAVGAFGMIVAGIMRRRSGFLAGTTMVLLLGGALGLFGGSLAGISTTDNNGYTPGSGEHAIAQAGGILQIQLEADAVPGEDPERSELDVRKRDGTTYVFVYDHVTAWVDVTTDHANVRFERIDENGTTVASRALQPDQQTGAYEWQTDGGTEPRARRVVTIDQHAGDIVIMRIEEAR